MTSSKFPKKAQSIQLTIIGLFAVLKQSESWNMERLTVTPNISFGMQRETVNRHKVLQEVLEFEDEIGPAFEVTEIKIRTSDCEDLCRMVEADHDIITDTTGRKPIKMVPVVPEAEFAEPPTFQYNCYGWIRKQCVGTARSPFDNRCHFWVPYITDAACQGSKSHRARRKREIIEEVVVGGLEAVNLCMTRALVGFGHAPQLVYDKLTLPQNVELKLRCMSFRLTSDGWTKSKVSDAACDYINKGRPAASSVNTDITDDDFRDIIKCFSRDTIVICQFQSAWAEDPDS